MTDAPNRRAFAMVEEVLDLDVAAFRRAGHLTEGARGSVTWRWTSGCVNEVRFAAGRACIAVAWRDRSGDPQTQRIDIRWTPCRFGGRRPWFECGSCHRQVVKVYLTRGSWACRRCSGLNYECQMSRDPSVSHRAMRLRRRLGIEDVWRAEPVGPIERPPGMRQRTFERLVARLREEEARYEARYMARLSQILNLSRSPR